MQCLGTISKKQNDLCPFPRQAIQCHSNPSLCPNHECLKTWSWKVLRRPTRPRTNTHTHTKRCRFHHRGLECKSKKSRNTWSNRQVWPWNTKWSRAKAEFCQENALVIANTLFQQYRRWFYTWRSPDGQYCREPAWGILPVAKVMRKGAWQNAKAGSGLRNPPGFSQASTPKIRVCLLYRVMLSTYSSDITGGLSSPPPTFFWKKLI